MIPTAITYDFIKSMFGQKSFVFREENEYANLFGYRSKDLTVVDKFNDLLGVAYKDYFGNNQCLMFPGTTKPGMFYLQQQLGNQEGTWILAPGQYLDCWTPGLHAGKYLALIQSGAKVFKGWRDKTLDGKFDMNGQLYDDCTGVDFHTVRTDGDVNDVVFNASSGCQVVRDGRHFEVALNLVLRTFEVFPTNKINYTLFQES